MTEPSQAEPQAKTLSPEVLFDYAMGALDPASSLLAATHVALNQEARRLAALFDVAGGGLLEETPPVALSDGALDALFKTIDASGGEAEASPPETADGELDGLPEPLRSQALKALEAGRWRFNGKGIKALDLGYAAGPRGVLEGGGESADRGAVTLYRIEPGRAVPRHTHEAGEVTLCVTGAFSDGIGRYAPGEISFANPDVTHRPRAEPGAVCHALALTDGKLLFKGGLGLLQRATGAF